MLVGAYGARWQLRNRIPTRQPSQGKLGFISRQVAMSYCIPLAFAASFMWVQFSGYRFFVENYWGVEKLGFLVVGMQVASQFWILIESLAMQFFYPLMFKQVSLATNPQEQDAALSDLVNTLLPVYLILTGMLLLSAKYMLSILAAPQYQAALTFTLLGAGIELCRSVGNLLGLAAQVKRETRSAALPYFAGATTALVIIAWAGGQRLDVGAAALALALAGAVMLAAMAWRMSRLVKFSIDATRLLMALLLMVGMAAVHAYVPDIVWVGWRLALLAGLGFLISLLVLALLYKSPGARRLIAVRLRKGAA
jgi:O-antigen/teichoic acid export membrane protein